MEKELKVLETLNEDPFITQRGISKKSGLSVGTVNLVLERLIRDGLVKIEKIPSHRIAYILTPDGIREKINKTRAYLRVYYDLYDKERERIKILIEQQYHGEKIETAISDPILLRLAQQVVEELGLGQFQEEKLFLVDNASESLILKDGHKVINIDC